MGRDGILGGSCKGGAPGRAATGGGGPSLGTGRGAVGGGGPMG